MTEHRKFRKVNVLTVQDNEIKNLVEFVLS